MKQTILIGFLALCLAMAAHAGEGLAFTSPLESPVQSLDECYAECEGEYAWACEKGCRCRLGVDEHCTIDDYERERPCPPPHAEKLPDLWMGQYPLWQWTSVEGTTYTCVEGWR